MEGIPGVPELPSHTSEPVFPFSQMFFSSIIRFFSFRINLLWKGEENEGRKHPSLCQFLERPHCDTYY